MVRVLYCGLVRWEFRKKISIMPLNFLMKVLAPNAYDFVLAGQSILFV